MMQGALGSGMMAFGWLVPLLFLVLLVLVIAALVKYIRK